MRFRRGKFASVSERKIGLMLLLTNKWYLLNDNGNFNPCVYSGNLTHVCYSVTSLSSHIVFVNPLPPSLLLLLLIYSIKLKLCITSKASQSLSHLFFCFYCCLFELLNYYYFLF